MGPGLCLLDEVRAQGVAFDVANGGDQVAVLLDGESLEAPLPDVAAAAVVAVIPPDMRGHQPLHPAAQVAVVVRPEHQVEMVGHQAQCEDAHGQALAGGLKQAKEGVVVVGLLEDGGAAIAPIEHVVDDPADTRASGSSHRCMIISGPWDVSSGVGP